MMNKLLAALPSEEFEKISSELKPVSLSLGEIIKEADMELKYVYFPTTAIISLFHLMEDGTTVDITLLGNDGMLGFSIFMDGSKTPQWAVARNNGNAFRLPSKLIREIFSHCGDFQDLMLLYAQTSMTYISQAAVCNRLHSVEQRLSRTLLVF
ncbi:MAG TPA: Crp/Fnr family transcriptional regulator, partial [Pyrinomonadaceae bacterium]|nr:Crp/Fnr family transcriptional regulator [Pyrinomonadaceae bacterium]